MDELTQTIIKKLQRQFKATDQAAQQAITEEVLSFLNLHQDVEEEDIAALEQLIRSRLANNKGPAQQASKHSRFGEDEWSKINQWMAFMAKEDEKRHAKETCAKKQQTRVVLAEQMQAARQRKAALVAAKQQEHQRVEQELAQWEQQVQENKASQKAQIVKLKAEREAQLADLRNRLELAGALKRKGAQDMTARISEEARRQLEAEKAARVKAQEALQKFLSGNEATKQLKEAEKQRQLEEDREFSRLFAEQLDKQERQRAEQLERIHLVQARQAADAAQRQPVKRWVDEAVIQRQFEEKQAAAAAEDARRKQQVVDRASKFRADVAGQLAEKEAAKLAALEQQRKDLVASMADLEISKKIEASDKARELEKMRGFRGELDRQIADNRARQARSAMTDTEKKLNSKLLQEMEALQQGGAHGSTVPAVRAS